MRCEICRQKDVDGALDQNGNYVCVDCWANGEAYMRGMKATVFTPASFCMPVDYPTDMQERFLDACNGAKKVRN